MPSASSARSKRSNPRDHGDFDVDIRPDAAALRMFRSLSFTPWYALGEFLDNSISSYFQNRSRLEKAFGPEYTCRVEVEFDPRAARLVVSDNAAGITKRDLPRAVRTGEPPDDTSVGLNLHGVGMKAAAFWWGRHLTIETWPLGERSGWKVEIDIGKRGTRPQTTAVVRRIAKREQSGTRITIDGLWQNAPVASKTRATTAAYLPSIYRKFISIADSTEHHAVELYLDSQRLSFEPPALLRAPYWPSSDGPAKGGRSKLWRKDVSITLASGKRIQGWIGILETMSRELSGFTLHYRGKGIGGVAPIGGEKAANSGFRPRAIFGQAGSYRAQSFIGEFDVTDFGKSITTDSTLWTPDEEDEFVARVLGKLKLGQSDMWSMAVNFKRRKRDQLETKKIAGASSLAAKQLGKAVSGVISHKVADTDFVDTESVRDEVAFTIVDKEIHAHRFGLRFSDQRARPFLTVVENAARREHHVVVNEAHPLFDDLPPVDALLRTLLTRLALSLAAAEVFTEDAARHLIRTKMNEVLDFVHPQPPAEEG